jgi:hypothetical protein
MCLPAGVLRCAWYVFVRCVFHCSSGLGMVEAQSLV